VNPKIKIPIMAGKISKKQVNVSLGFIIDQKNVAKKIAIKT
jgi:hypothetical protein